MKATTSTKIQGFHRNILVLINFLISKVQNFISIIWFCSRYEEKDTYIGFLDTLTESQLKFLFRSLTSCKWEQSFPLSDSHILAVNDTEIGPVPSSRKGYRIYTSFKLLLLASTLETLQSQQKTSARKLIKSMSEMELAGEIHFSVKRICLTLLLGC